MSHDGDLKVKIESRLYLHPVVTQSTVIMLMPPKPPPFSLLPTKSAFESVPFRSCFPFSRY